MRIRIIRSIVYAVVIFIGASTPRAPGKEVACAYSAFLAPIYIGEEIGILERNNQTNKIGEICSIYLGFPIIYISDIYDVWPPQVSIPRLILNILVLSLVAESMIFAVVYYIRPNRP